MRRALFVLLFLSYAYFYQAGGWNQNSRFALVRAITNDWSLRIDPYQRNTGDKAIFEGHYYSDKAPGLSLLAVPIVEPVRLVYKAGGGDPETFEGLALLSYFATVLTVGLFTAWAGVALYDVALSLGNSPGGALFAALSFGLATPMWWLATTFIGHALSASCLVFGFVAAYRIHAEPQPATDSVNGWIVGLGAGWATVSEFPAAIPAVLFAAWAAASAMRLEPGRARRILTGLVCGAGATAGVLMLYQYACFGSPFHLAYSSEEGFEGLQQGLFGITLPTAHALQQILFSEFRGLLPLSPLMIVAPVGLFMYRDARTPATIAFAVALFYILLNASYHYWEGGWSLGPRHLSPALPFLCLGLASLWSRSGRGGRAVLLALWLVSAGVSLVAVSTMPQPPANIPKPMRDLVWPAFRAGDLALNTQTFVHYAINPAQWRTHEDPKAAFNLGMKLGLDGHTSLAPLVIGWALCAWWIVGEMRRQRAVRVDRGGNGT